MTDQVSDDKPQGGVEPPAKTADAQAGAEDFDKDRALATIRTQRETEAVAKKALAAANKELETLRAAQKATEDAKLSDSEKTQKRLTELEQNIAEQKAQAADAEAKRQALETELAGERRANRVAKVAAGLGAHDPHDANILAATAGIDATGDKAEELIGKAIEKLKTDKPYLFKRAGNSLEPFNPGTGSGVAETDTQRVNRLHSQAQQGKGPFGR